MKIEFYPSSKEVELVVPAPRPAAHYTPKWYRDAPKFSEKDVNLDRINSEGIGLKSCMPFLDSMMAGYIQETWQDIVVDYREDRLSVTFPATPEILKSRDRIHIPLSQDFYQTEFTWQIPWMPKLPKGWSMIYTSPFNHAELPFQCATGIVDSDAFYHIPFGNYPFYIKQGFRGVIPAGTPMFQMIPIKRESWSAKSHKFNAVEQMKREYPLRQKSFGGYKKLFHIKKEYL